jgi:hypothetical protein
MEKYLPASGGTTKEMLPQFSVYCFSIFNVLACYEHCPGTFGYSLVFSGQLILGLFYKKIWRLKFWPHRKWAAAAVTDRCSPRARIAARYGSPLSVWPDPKRLVFLTINFSVYKQFTFVTIFIVVPDAGLMKMSKHVVYYGYWQVQASAAVCMSSSFVWDFTKHSERRSVTMGTHL